MRIADNDEDKSSFHRKLKMVEVGKRQFRPPKNFDKKAAKGGGKTETQLKED